MLTLGEMIKTQQVQALNALKSELPKRRLREEADPGTVCVEALLYLLGLCVRYERLLPREVRDQVKVAVAARGRAARKVDGDECLEHGCPVPPGSLGCPSCAREAFRKKT